MTLQAAFSFGCLCMLHRFSPYEGLLSVQIFQPVIEIVEGFEPFAATIRELFIIAKLQKEALCELLHRLLQRGEKLPVGKIACRCAIFKGAGDERFRHLVERVHFEMYQLVHDDLFQILLLGIGRVQQENGFSVVAVYLEIAGLVPGGILHKLQLHIPRRYDPQLFAVFIKNLS